MTVTLQHKKLGITVYDLLETGNGEPRITMEFAGMKYSLVSLDKEKNKAIYKEIEA